MVGIYKITNLVTGDFYIGKSKNIRKRWDNHKQKGIHTKCFETDIQKYGWESFAFEMIEECEESDLIEREAFYIEFLKPPYNMVVRGRKLDDETRRKISIKLTGRKQSEETKIKRRETLKRLYKEKPRTNEKHKKRVLIDGKEYESVIEAGKYLGCDPGYLSRMKKEGRNKYKGHDVRYVV